MKVEYFDLIIKAVILNMSVLNCKTALGTM